jgi:tetratricopeptide (TPR) repeat protein
VTDFSAAIGEFFERTGASTAQTQAQNARTRAILFANASESDRNTLKKAEVLASLGDYETALEIAARVVAKAEWSPRARHILAHCYLMRGDQQAALEEYDRVLTEEPSDAGGIVRSCGIAFADRLGVSDIILMPLHIGLHVSRRHQANGMAQSR